MSASTDFRIKQQLVIEFLTLEGCVPLEGDDFVKNFATGDESLAHHYDPENKRQSVDWFSECKKIQNSSIGTKSHAHHLFGRKGCALHGISD
jgi:hypothetical protein